jgi:hypothetical protein
VRDEIATFDRGPWRRFVFRRAGAGCDELTIDRANLEAAGMVGLNPVRYSSFRTAVSTLASGRSSLNFTAAVPQEGA